MFAGANYLGLSGEPRVIDAACRAMQEYGCAAGGSRLISGNMSLHEALERELAQFLGSDAALIFSTGYMANIGVLTTLAGPSDVIVSDELNHASIVDGCRLSRAEVRVFRHNDANDFRRLVASLAGFRRRILIVDGVFSMDGDVACLSDLVPIARQHEMLVILDDAHGIGVLGDDGRGVAQQEAVEVDVRIGNLGKAMGSFGSFVACSQTMREYFVNRSRSFIFTCALPPSAIAAAREALRLLRSEPTRRETLRERATQLRDGVRRVGYDCGRSNTHIVPLILGDNEVAMRLCEKLLSRGIFAQGIRFPSVPHGTARVRMTPMCSHSANDIACVVDTLAELRHHCPAAIA